MMHSRRLAQLTAIIGLAALFVAKGNAMEIAANGQTQVAIVVDVNATAPEQHAAAELAHFLGLVTGASFVPVNVAPCDGSRILVGPDAATAADPAFTVDGLGAEGIVIRTVGDDLILAGGRPRGTLYAVYTFLEDYVGCRWWTSTAQTIPSRASLTIAGLDVCYVPILEYRESFWFDAFDGDWAVRNKSNGHTERIDPVRGGRHLYEGFAHTFYPLIPPPKYFAEHPEWYSLVAGKRTHQVIARPNGAEIPMPAQLCLTNESMRQELVKNLKARLRANPQATIASISANDDHPGFDGRCECENCAALEAKEGSPAGPLLHFVNAVAADIEQEFPHVAISTLAYHYTRKPPKYVRPRPNVIVRLCSIECSFVKPLTDEANKDFRDDIIAWSKISNRLYIWDYVTNHAQNLLPQPNLRVLAPNIRFFVDHHAKGIFEQGAYVCQGAEMAELKAWVLAKLLWKASLDDRMLIEEFVNGYYGPAGPHMLAYLDLMHDAAEATGDWLGCWSPPDAAFLNFDVLSRGLGHLRAAEASVREDPERLFRVQSAQLPVIYTFLMRWTDMRAQAAQANAKWPLADSVDVVHQEFMAIAGKKGVVHLNEGCTGFQILDEAVAKAKQ